MNERKTVHENRHFFGSDYGVKQQQFGFSPFRQEPNFQSEHTFEGSLGLRQQTIPFLELFVRG